MQSLIFFQTNQKLCRKEREVNIMYFVDREKIEDTLSYLESITSIFKEQKEFNDVVQKLAVERMTHLMIEAILDVGNAMIDGFIMRDPGSYDDIIDILEDESVIGTEDSQSLKKIIAFRKVLVQEYVSINHEMLIQTLQSELVAIESFPHSVRTYIQNELGPVSAFKK